MYGGKMVTEESGKNDYTENAEVTGGIRSVLSAWAETIPHHGIKNFGEEIDITKVQYSPSVILEVQTQYEKRNVETRTESYRGSGFPPPEYKSTRDVEPWEFSLSQPSSFSTETNNYPVKGSETMITCADCDGVGKNTCDVCRGAGQETCPSCGGKGTSKCGTCRGTGKMDCPRCSGSGGSQCPECGGAGMKWYSEHKTVKVSDFDEKSVEVRDRKQCRKCGGTGRVRCSYCSGSKKVTCRSCSGKGYLTCKKCAGKGAVTCSKCRGAGQITCVTCSGAGNLKQYYVIVQQLKQHLNGTTIFEPEVDEQFPDFNVGAEDVNEEIASAEGQMIEASQLNVPDLEPAFTGLLDKSHSESPLGPVAGALRIINEKGTIGLVHMYWVTYRFQDKDYSLLVYGPESRVYAPQSPFADMSYALFERAEKLCRKGFYGKCLDALDKAEVLDVEGENTDIGVLREKAQKRMLRHYRWGEYVGKAAAGIAAWFCIVHLKLIPDILLPAVSELYGRITWSAEIYTWILTAVTVVTIFAFYRKLRYFLNRSYGYIVRNGIIRFGVSFLYAVLFSALVYAAVMLAHMTGIIPLAVYGVNAGYELVINFVGASE